MNHILTHRPTPRGAPAASITVGATSGFYIGNNALPSIGEWSRLRAGRLPTGELDLTPGGRVDLSRDEAIDLLVGKAVANVIELIEKARKRREAEEAERRREWERQHAIAAEKERVEAMRKAATLREYRVSADYIEEVRRFGRVRDDQRREGQTLDDWLAGAETQAQRIHPLGD